MQSISKYRKFYNNNDNYLHNEYIMYTGVLPIILFKRIGIYSFSSYFALINKSHN